MKKNIFIAALLLSTAALSVSCTKEKISLADETGYETVTLQATFSEPDTKITFTGETELKTLVGWENGDCIWVRSNTQPMWERGERFCAETISQDGHTATFTGRTRKEGLMAAVYPYGPVLDMSNNDVVYIDYPMERPLVKGNCPAASLAAAGFWNDGSTSFTMNFAVGAVKFSIKGNGEKVSKFELIGTAKDQALWGTLTIKPDYQTKGIAEATMANSDPMRNRTYLIPAEELTIGAEPVDFYFVLPAGGLAQGFVLNAYGADGEVVGQLSSDKDNSIVCGKVVRMPEAVLLPPQSGDDVVITLEGTGTESDPYKIDGSDKLAYLSKLMASAEDYADYCDKYYVQTADIDMANVEFTSVGTVAQPFKGYYDGNGKTIANLETRGTDSDNPASGVFAYAEGATVKNLTLSGRTNIGSYGIVGGLIGLAKNCTVTNCHLTGSELSATVNICGGLIAETEGGTITGCTISNSKISNTKNYAGGIVGYAGVKPVIENCQILAGTEVSGANEIGGIVAKMEGGSIKTCSVTGAKVSGSSEDIGAIGGWVIGSCVIEDCTVSGCEIHSADDYAGGVAGLMEKSTIRNCVVTGTKVSGVKTGIGGFVGYLKKADASLIENCALEGASSVSGSQNVGGYVGWFDAGTLKNCVVQGNSTVTGTGDGVGGLIGRAVSRSGSDDIIESCVVRGGTVITGTYSLAGLVGYAYPDSNGNLYILNSGVVETTIHGLSSDSGGDCMNAGMVGWARLSDSGSKAWIVNCYSYLEAINIDVTTTHPSVGGIVGYGSLSSAGKLEIINCTSNLTADRITLAGVPVTADATQTGTLYGWLPNSAGVRVASNHYVQDGVLPVGTNGESAVIESNAGYAKDVFKDGSTVNALLNAYVSTCTDYQLKSWASAAGAYPFCE